MRTVPLSQFFIGVFALVIFISSIYVYAGVSTYGAGFMPTTLSGILLIFTLLDGGIHYLQPKHPAQRSPKWTLDEIRALLLVAIAITLFVLLIDTAGFILCAIGLVFTLTVLKRPKKIWSSLIFATATALIIDYLFADILMVALPQGLWG